MPLVRIDMPTGKTPEQRRIIGDVIYDAMIATLNVPQNDRFQIISERESCDLIIDPTYLGVARSPAAIIIQVTLNEGRSVELKQSFYKAVADGLRDRAGMRPEDVFISLVEVKKENWSFGNGVAQYAIA
jgi:phenylpyruvate tautomerase PptA (4-oxalocrotonate tautomerase family)